MPIVLRHQDAVELDLFDRGVDFRDYFRPGGGESRLTTRRLLLLLCGMDPLESRFWMGCGRLDLWVEFNDGITPNGFMPTGNRLLSDIVGMFAEKPHPWRTWREDYEHEKRQATKREAIMRANAERQRRIALSEE